MINIKKILIRLLNLEFYTSPIDLFLEKFSKEHPDLSASQRREKEKYAHIFNQGDNVTDKTSKIWDKF
mgnify:CR=1 FL=1